MSGELHIAGDFSGIQAYVLNVSAAGGGQARRLRARSFFVELAGEVTVWKLLQAFGCGWDAVVASGGGNFLVRVPSRPDGEETLSRLRTELESQLFEDTGGELGLSLAWGGNADEALQKREGEKGRLWARTMNEPGGWTAARLSLEGLRDLCEICRRRSATATREDDGERIHVCSRCDGDTEVGRRLPHAEFVRLREGAKDFVVLGQGVELQPVREGAGLIPRSMKRHIPLGPSGLPLTFEEIAALATGDNLLGVLKADVDNMGARVSQAIRTDSSLGLLRQLSRDLDAFFRQEVQRKLAQPEWSSIYTIYSGGDDLLLVGPWDTILDFSGVVRDAFGAGPGKTYGLTLSAGIALTSYRLPIRHGVDSAEECLERSKQGAKDQCSALGATWKWTRHQSILEQAKRIVSWINSDICGRALIHRLLVLSESSEPRRAALWAYEVGRNFPRRDDRDPERREFRSWGEAELAGLHLAAGSLQELCIELRYALTATRARRVD
jgi:CRISPR-associated protein Csm1